MKTKIHKALHPEDFPMGHNVREQFTLLLLLLLLTLETPSKDME